MHQKIQGKYKLLFLGIVASILLVVGVFLATNSFASKSVLVEKLVLPLARIVVIDTHKVGIPTRLRIPKIGVDAAVENVGVTSSGAMAVPKGPNGVGWYSPGLRPGEIGSAVMAGHYGWKNGISAVFDHLDQIKKGDQIYVEDDRGITTIFVASDVRAYGEKDNATEIFVSDDRKAHLNLITCEGVWNSSTKSYSKRLVIFADKKS